MALAFQLQGAGFTPTELATEAAVSLEKEGQRFDRGYSRVKSMVISALRTFDTGQRSSSPITSRRSASTTV
jgi:hypothetical protein